MCINNGYKIDDIYVGAGGDQKPAYQLEWRWDLA